MERLTEKELYDGNVCYTKCSKTNCTDKCYDCPVAQEVDVRLKEYEDLEEQGLLLRLRCIVSLIVAHGWTLAKRIVTHARKTAHMKEEKMKEYLK